MHIRQEDLDAYDADFESKCCAAYELGQQHGANDIYDNPFESGTAEFNAYLEGYASGVQVF